MTTTLAPELAVQPADSPLRPRAAFTRFRDYARGTRRRLLAVTALASVPSAVEVGQLWLFKDIVNSAAAHAGMARYVVLAALFGALAVAEGIAVYVGAMLAARASQAVVRRLRTDFFDHVQSLSLDFFERRPLGDILTRVTTDVEAVETFLFSGLATGAAAVVSLLLGGGALLLLDWRLILISAVVAPVFYLLSRLFRRRMGAAARELQRSEGAIGAAGEQALSNAMLVQAYNRGRWERHRFDRAAGRRFAAELVAVRLQSLFSPMIDFVETAGAMIVLGFGVWDLDSGRLTLGGLVAFVALLSRIYLPVATLTALVGQFYGAAASAERLGEFLDERPAVAEPVHPRALTRRGRIDLRGVGFRYPGSDRAALRDVELTVPAGQTVAVVGPSGSGKSTLVKLLLRFYDPSAGSVLIDGVDLRETSTTSVRDTVTVLLQESLMFDGTIADNIAYGRADATPAQIEAAGRAAGVAEFALDLPDGYDTVVGQRGRLLSGGQRQRVALARALIREPSILVLDEPTTGLDATSSERLMATLRRSAGSRTTLIVTHDLASIGWVDSVVVVADGRVRPSTRGG